MTYYDIIAHHFSSTRSRLWPDQILFLNKIKPGSEVLDLGCGNARVLQYFKKINIDYLGIDSSSLLLAAAINNFPNAKFILGDITKAGTFKNLKKYDYVLLFAVLHHILTKNAQEKLFKNISKITKSRAKIFITVWNMKQTKYRTMKSKHKIFVIPYKFTDGKKVQKEIKRDIFAYEPEDIINLAKNNGYRVLDYFYARKGVKTYETSGYNLCFELQKEV